MYVSDKEVSLFLIHPVEITSADRVWSVVDSDSVLCALEDRAVL